MKNLLFALVLLSAVPFSSYVYAQDADEDDDESSFFLLRGIAYNVGTDLIGFADSYLRVLDIMDDEEEEELDNSN